jgi:hypothetical protein
MEVKDQEHCQVSTDVDTMCCFGIDKWFEDCPETSKSFPRLYTKEYLEEQCKQPTRIERLASKCPNGGYTVPDKTKDHSDCKEVSKSVESIICAGIDKFISNCPYQSFIDNLDQNYLEQAKATNTAVDCSKYSEKFLKPPPVSSNKSSLFTLKNISIMLLLLLVTILIYKLSTKKK